MSQATAIAWTDLTEADAAVYRRGYLAGYSAGRRGSLSLPDGAPTGRPRERLAVSA
jgi:hypothetical protein